MVAVGGFIFYNTHILNPYRTTFTDDEARAQYEKKYRQYWALPQPRITDVNVQLDFYPDQRSVAVRGTMWLENKTDTPIDRVAITLWPDNLCALAAAAHQDRSPQLRGRADRRCRRSRARLLSLQASYPACRRMGASSLISRCNTTIPASRIRSPIPTSSDNGSFVNDRYLPYIGYAQDIELTDDSTRHKHGLEKVRRLPKLDDVAARQYNSVSFDADWINFDATVSTSPDQIAIAPGYLQKEWVRERPALLPLQDGRAHPGPLFIPVGALRGAARPLGRREPGDLLPARPRVRSRHHDAEHEGDARLLHRRTSAPSSFISCASSSFPATAPSRNRSRTPFPSPSPSASSPRSATQARRRESSVLRDRARDRASVVGAPGDLGLCPGRDVDRRDHGAVHRADGDEAPFRTRVDEALPSL